MKMYIKFIHIYGKSSPRVMQKFHLLKNREKKISTKFSRTTKLDILLSMHYQKINTK